MRPALLALTLLTSPVAYAQEGAVAAEPRQKDSYTVAAWFQPMLMAVSDDPWRVGSFGLNFAIPDAQEIGVELTVFDARWSGGWPRDDTRHAQGFIAAAGPVFRWPTGSFDFFVQPQLLYGQLKEHFTGAAFAIMTGGREPFIPRGLPRIIHLGVDIGVQRRLGHFFVSFVAGVNGGYGIDTSPGLWLPWGTLFAQPWQRTSQVTEEGSRGFTWMVNPNLLRLGAAF